jgi:hypothetical protein
MIVCIFEHIQWRFVLNDRLALGSPYAQAEDALGFLLSEGGYARYEGGRPAPKGSVLAEFASKIGGPVEHVGKAVGPKLVEEMKAGMGPVAALLEVCRAEAAAAKKRWEAAGGQAQLDGTGGEEKLLAKIKVPTGEFQKAGLSAIVERFEKEGGWRKLQAQKSMAKQRLKKVRAEVTAGQRSENMRRGVGHLLQEIAMVAVRQELFPKVDEKVSELQLPTHGIVRQVQEMAHDHLEELTRKEVWSLVTATCDQMATALLPAGCGSAKEKGKDKAGKEVDEYGFLVGEGGFEALQTSALHLKPITLPRAQRSTDIRRGVGQLLQDMILPTIREKLFPEIDRRVDDLQLPSRMMERKLRGIVHDMGEEEIRRRIHRNLAGAFKRMSVALKPDGMPVAEEPGEELEEDEFGFLLSEGGFAQHKRTHKEAHKEDPKEAMQELVGVAGPFAKHIKKVIDPKLLRKLDEAVEMIRPVIETYKTKGEEIRQAWFDDPVTKQAMSEYKTAKGEHDRGLREKARAEKEAAAKVREHEQAGAAKVAKAAEKAEMERRKKGVDAAAAAAKKKKKDGGSPKKQTAGQLQAAQEQAEQAENFKKEMEANALKRKQAEIDELVVEWPIAKFQKDALMAAIESFKPLFATLKGENKGKALAVLSSIRPEDRTTDLRRKLVQSLSFCVLNPMRAALQPEIEKRVSKLKIESQMIRSRLTQMVFDQLEGIARKTMYGAIVEAGLDEGLLSLSLPIFVYMYNNRMNSKLKRIMTEHPRPNTGHGRDAGGAGGPRRRGRAGAWHGGDGGRVRLSDRRRRLF